MAYELVAGPLDGARIDYAAGVIASVIANVNRNKNAKSYAPDDFVLKWDSRVKTKMTNAEVAKAVHSALRPKAIRQDAS